MASRLAVVEAVVVGNVVVVVVAVIVVVFGTVGIGLVQSAV